MNDRLLSFLGIARKAGKLCFGKDAALEAIRKGKAKLVLLSSDLSEKTAEKMQMLCFESETSLLTMEETMDQLETIFRRRTGILCITDAGFAGKAHTLADNRG